MSCNKIPLIYGDMNVCDTSTNPTVKWPDMQIYDINKIQESCKGHDDDNTPGGCVNFTKNSQLVNFTLHQMSFLQPNGARALVNSLDMCKTDGLKEYVDWRVKNLISMSPLNPYQQLDMDGFRVINGTCKLGIDIPKKV
jgi:hypothetical protein